jgi:hypothetical protein
VLESIRGDAAANKFAEVTFTHETWARINQQMDSRFAHLAIVGWYHSHPSFGIFLSDRDRFIQEHFFSGPGQVAYVVDPVRKTQGMFLWRDGKPQLCPHFWVGDRVQVGTAAGEEPPVSAAKPELPADGGGQPATSLRRQSTPWTNVAAQVAMYLAVFLLGFLLAGKLTEVERLRIEQGTLARALVYFKIRLGLAEDLALVDANLRAATQTAKALSQEHLSVLQEPQEPQARWNEVLQTLTRSSVLLKRIGETYSLTPQEVGLLSTLTEPRSKPPANDAAAPKDPKTENKPKEETADSKREEKKP